jgi:hypothetical protein
MKLYVDTNSKQVTVTKDPTEKLEQNGRQKAERNTGRPMWSTQVFVLDDDGGEVITITTAGEKPSVKVTVRGRGGPAVVDQRAQRRGIPRRGNQGGGPGLGQDRLTGHPVMGVTWSARSRLTLKRQRTRREERRPIVPTLGQIIREIQREAAAQPTDALRHEIEINLEVQDAVTVPGGEGTGQMQCLPDQIIRQLISGKRGNDRTRVTWGSGLSGVRVPGLGGLISRCFVRFGCLVGDQLGGLAGDVLHLAEHAAKFALVGDPVGVAGGLAFGEPGGDGLAGDLAGELVAGAVRLGRLGLAAAAGLAAVGVAAGDAAGQGGADLAEPGGQGLVAAAQLRQVVGHVIDSPACLPGSGPDSI